MRKDANMTLRGSTWNIRVTVPKMLRDLRAQSGSTSSNNDIWRSTGTGDRNVARVLAAQIKAEVLTELFREFERLSRPVPTPEEMTVIAVQFRERERASLRQERLAVPNRAADTVILDRAVAALRIRARGMDPAEARATPEHGDVLVASVSSLEYFHSQRQLQIDELKEQLADSDYRNVEWAIWYVVATTGLRIDEGSLAHSDLCNRLIRIWIHELENAETRFLDVSESAEAGLPASLAGLSPAYAMGGLPFADAKPTLVKTAKIDQSLWTYFENYMDECHAGAVSASRKQRTATVRQFIEVCGSKAPALYTKADTADFKNAIRLLPADAFRRFGRKTVPQMLSLLTRTDKPQATKTVRSKLSIMSAFGKWLSDNVPGIDGGAFQTSPPKSDKRKLKINPYTDDQIVRIFHSTPFTGCRSERDQLTPGTHRVRDWRFWIPAIAAFSGARLNEIAQLDVTDITERDGVHVFRVTDEGENQSVKTAKSHRIVPIHSALLSLGFTDMVDNARRAGHAKLFEATRADTDGRRSTHAGRTYRKLMVRLGIKDSGERGGIQRFRHTFIDRLRAAGMADHEIAPLVGHDTLLAPMTAGYGAGQQMTVAQRQVAVERLRFDAFDLARLR